MQKMPNKTRVETADFREVKQVSNQTLLVVVAITEIAFLVVGFVLFRS